MAREPTEGLLTTSARNRYGRIPWVRVSYRKNQWKNERQTRNNILSTILQNPRAKWSPRESFRLRCLDHCKSASRSVLDTLPLKNIKKPVDGLTGSPLERLVSKTCFRVTVFSGSRPPKTPNKPPPGAVSRRDSTKESAEKAERES